MTPEERVQTLRKTTCPHIVADPLSWRRGECDLCVADEIRAAIAEEREACAQLAYRCDESAAGLDAGVDTGRIWRSAGARSIAAAIRARA